MLLQLVGGESWIGVALKQEAELPVLDTAVVGINLEVSLKDVDNLAHCSSVVSAEVNNLDGIVQRSDLVGVLKVSVNHIKKCFLILVDGFFVTLVHTRQNGVGNHLKGHFFLEPAILSSALDC